MEHQIPMVIIDIPFQTNYLIYLICILDAAGINIEKVLPYYEAIQSSTSQGSTWLYQPKGEIQRFFIITNKEKYFVTLYNTNIICVYLIFGSERWMGRFRCLG